MCEQLELYCQSSKSKTEGPSADAQCKLLCSKIGCEGSFNRT